MQNEARTKIFGVTFEDRQKNVKELQPGQQIYAIHEKDNPVSTTAMKLFADTACTKPLGYLKNELSRDLLTRIGEGWSYTYRVGQVTGGTAGKSFGCNIVITATPPPTASTPTPPPTA
jgi:hypothetical protein